MARLEPRQAAIDARQVPLLTPAQHAQVLVAGLGKPAESIQQHPLAKPKLDVAGELFATLKASRKGPVVPPLFHLGGDQQCVRLPQMRLARS